MMEYTFAFTLTLLCLIDWSLCQGTTPTCVSYDDSAPDCTKTNNIWALGTPRLLVTHRFFTTSTISIYLAYNLVLEDSSRVTLCIYEYHNDGTCSEFGSATANCSDCSNNINSGGYVDSTMSIYNMDLGKNRSVLSFTLGTPVQLLQFFLEECPQQIDNATAVNTSSHLCGYGCTSQFQCSDRTSPESTAHQCTARATWEPNTTLCFSETTTDNSISITPKFSSTQGSQESTTTRANSTTSTSPSITLPDPEKLVDCSKAAFTITSVGCILTVIFAVTVACVMKKVWRFKKEPAAKMFYLGFVAAAAACVLAIGLLFGSTAETKGIQGKKIEAAAEL